MAKIFLLQKYSFITVVIFALTSSVKGQICKFYGYNADCRYRVDGIVMTHITATINYCESPIDITFHLTATRPVVDWKHTFANDNEIQMVPGFDVSVQMQVLMRIVEENKLWVRADFDVDGRRKAYFIDENVELRHLESCVKLNEAGKIALGCLITLLIIAGILLVILIIVRRKRKLLEQNNDRIIEQMEDNEHISASSMTSNTSNNVGHRDQCDNDNSVPVVRYSLPTIPEQSESSCDSGHVSIELTNGSVPCNNNTQSGV